MTKLSYKVNGNEYTSYAQAVEASKGGRYSITRVYTPVYESASVDPVQRAKRIAAIQAKAKAARQ